MLSPIIVGHLDVLVLRLGLIVFVFVVVVLVIIGSERLGPLSMPLSLLVRRQFLPRPGELLVHVDVLLAFLSLGLDLGPQVLPEHFSSVGGRDLARGGGGLAVLIGLGGSAVGGCTGRGALVGGGFALAVTLFEPQRLILRLPGVSIGLDVVEIGL